MIRMLVLIACLAGLGGAAAWTFFMRQPVPEGPVQEAIGGVVWERRPGLAVKKARESGKPLLMVFRCPP